MVKAVIRHLNSGIQRSLNTSKLWWWKEIENITKLQLWRKIYDICKEYYAKCLKKIEFRLKMKVEDNEAPSLMKMEEKSIPVW